jgi:hypothetical protein
MADIAGFARGIGGAMTVKDACGPGLLDKLKEALLLGDPDLRIGR